MLFNSTGYLLFLPATVLLYYALPFRFRWLVLLAASYFFYLLWRVEFAIVLLTATAASYAGAVQMSRYPDKKKRKKVLWAVILVNIGMLIVFKYLGFFTEIVNQVSKLATERSFLPVTGIILPVGISFYTFQTIGYAIDVYRGVFKPEKDFGRYALFVSFFPLVLAGPIERAPRLIPQLRRDHPFDPELFASGLRLILWGLFKKVVIADRISIYVQPVFSNYHLFHGPEIAIAIFIKMMQVYADFSGYTDIAIGSARLFGIRLGPNFNRPFSARSIADFWARWHISLTSWLRDYVYFSLPFKYRGRKVNWLINLNLFIIFVLVGFWHGPYWNFLIFGILHGSFIVLERVFRPVLLNFNRITTLDRRPALLTSVNIVATMFLLTMTGFFFGPHPLSDSLGMMAGMLDLFNSDPSILMPMLKNGDLILGVLLVIFMLLFEYLTAERSFAVKFKKQPMAVRFSAYLTMLFFILIFGISANQEFFYFQF